MSQIYHERFMDIQEQLITEQLFYH